MWARCVSCRAEGEVSLPETVHQVGLLACPACGQVLTTVDVSQWSPWIEAHVQRKRSLQAAGCLHTRKQSVGQTDDQIDRERMRMRTTKTTPQLPMTSLELIADLWTTSAPGDRCPHATFADNICHCGLFAEPQATMVCDMYSLQLWCLAGSERYPKCIVYQDARKQSRAAVE
jgi:hypothetical protein